MTDNLKSFATALAGFVCVCMHVC